MGLKAGYFLLIEVIFVFYENRYRESHSRIMIPLR